jgi:hypothetical protein
MAKAKRRRSRPPLKKRKGAQAPAGVPRYLKGVSPWITESTDPYTLRKQYGAIRDGMRKVRKLFAGFEAQDGYDLNRLFHWPKDRVETARRFITYSTRLSSGEFFNLYTIVYPRTAAQAAALRLHTGQLSPDPDKHRQKGFVVYANVPKARIRYVEEEIPTGAAMGRPTVRRQLRAELVQPVKGGALLHRDYLFREILGFQPGVDSATPEGLRVGRLLGTFDPWEQMVIAMRRLVTWLPDTDWRGNEAYYRLLTDRGPIYSAVPKHMLVQLMQQWGEQYDEASGFAGTLIGTRYQGSEFKARKAGVQRDQRRARYRRLSEDLRRARGRLDGQTGRILPKPKKKRVAPKKKKRASRTKPLPPAKIPQYRTPGAFVRGPARVKSKQKRSRKKSARKARKHK